MDAVELKRLETEAVMREAQDLRVFVVGGGFQYTKMFFDAGFKGARSVEDASVVCFTGGADVHPSYYGEDKIAESYCDKERDDAEAAIFAQCVALQKPMVGICRGSQFLNVMNGGKLYQHVNNHATHAGHGIITADGKEIGEMTSTHHQMMIPGKGASVLALAAEATFKKTDKSETTRPNPKLDDVEVVWYADSLSLCFQPHPEFSHGPCRNYFLDLVDEYILPAC